MKKLVLGALLGAAASSTACTSAAPTDAVVTASWSFSTYANRKQAPTDPCPAGFSTATVHAREWDPFLGEFVAGGLDVQDKFNCSDKIGTTDPLDGVFLIWVSIESTSGGTVYAESESEFFDTIDGDATISLPTLFKDAGFFDLTWDLVKNGARVHCQDVGIGSSGSVSATAISVVSPSFMAIDKFTCADGFGTSEVLPVDTYDITVTASTGSSDVGASGPIADVPIHAPNVLTHLGHVKIPVQ
jgi:hypothetical protein